MASLDQWRLGVSYAIAPLGCDAVPKLRLALRCPCVFVERVVASILCVVASILCVVASILCVVVIVVGSLVPLTFSLCCLVHTQ